MALILVIDDDVTSLQLFETILRRGGHDVIISDDPMNALALVRHYQPQVVIVDDMMPYITGAELSLLIKQDAYLSATPVILTSAGARIHDDDYTKTSRADYVLGKPFLLRDVLTALEKVQRIVSDRTVSP